MLKWAEHTYTGTGTGKRDEQESFVAWSFILLFVCAIITLGLNAWSTSSGGLDDQEHPNSLPAGVTQLDRHTYTVDANTPRPVLLADICWGDLYSGGENKESVPKPLGGKRLIQCGRGQTWNVKKPKPPSFKSAAIGTLTTPGWFMPHAVVFLLLAMYPLLLTVGSYRAGAPARKEARRAKKQKPLDLEQARKELVKSYTTGDINDLEFQTGMDKLYASGLPRSD